MPREDGAGDEEPDDEHVDERGQQGDRDRPGPDDGRDAPPAERHGQGGDAVGRAGAEEEGREEEEVSGQAPRPVSGCGVFTRENGVICLISLDI